MSDAAYTEEIAARWLLRREEKNWSDQDQTDLEAWLEADMENKVAYWRLEHGWQKTNRLAALQQSVSPPYTPARARMWRIAVVGVPLAACLIAGVFVVSKMEPIRGKTYATEIGTREIVPLADGTQIELNTASKLRADVNGQLREVWLEQGEVFFDVVHDAARPFVVHAGRSTLTDLGTKFSVRRNGDRVEVAVVSGRVQLGSGPTEASTMPVTLARGDIAILQGTSTSVVPNSVDKVNDLLSWRQGMLVFDQVTLADAASEFNRYSRRSLIIIDPAVAQMRISGRFEASNVDAFTRLLRLAYGIKVADEGAVVKLSN